MSTQLSPAAGPFRTVERIVQGRPDFRRRGRAPDPGVDP